MLKHYVNRLTGNYNELIIMISWTNYEARIPLKEINTMPYIIILWLFNTVCVTVCAPDVYMTKRRTFLCYDKWAVTKIQSNYYWELLFRFKFWPIQRCKNLDWIKWKWNFLEFFILGPNFTVLNIGIYFFIYTLV